MMTNSTLRLVLTIALAVVTGLFCFFNWHYVDVRGGVFKLTAPLALVVIGFGAIGFALGRFWGRRTPRV